MKFTKNLTPKHVRMVFLGIIILISAIIFQKIVQDVFWESKSGNDESLTKDNAILKRIYEIRENSLTQSMIDITSLGSVSVISLLISIIVIFLISHKDWNGVFYLLVVALGSLVIPVFLKNYFSRVRPDILERLVIVKNSSFPSGHSFGATVTYLSFVFLLSRELKDIKLEVLYYSLAAFIIALVGASRMYLGVHYPTDIFGGVVVGIIWFSMVSISFLYFSKPVN